MLRKISVISMAALCITGGGFPDPHEGHPGIPPGTGTFGIKEAADDHSELFAGRIATGGADLLEFSDAPGHRVGFIQDDLVIKTLDNWADGVIINQYTGFIIHFALDAYLNSPVVAVKPGAFALIVEETVTGIKTHFFEEPGPHSRNICRRGI
jgi:hypothetical protein